METNTLYCVAPETRFHRRVTGEVRFVEPFAGDTSVGATPVHGEEIVVVAVLLLFAEFGSVSVAVTVAVFETLPEPSACTTSVMIAEAFGASEPMLQVMGETFVHEPCVVLTETNVVPAGIGSVTVTLVAVAVEVASFFTRIEYVMFWFGLAVAEPLF